MVLQSNTSSATKSQSGFILQTANSLTGRFQLTSDCTGVGAAQGSVNGTDVSLAETQTSQNLNLTGTAAADGSTMQGNYTILASGCGSSDVGTWTATQVKPINGSFSGSFTSSAIQGLIYPVTGMVTQGSNTGGSSASLTGTMASTGAPCFSNVNLAGMVSGTTVVFNLLTSDGTAIGQFRPIATSDGTKLSGQYDINPQSQLPQTCRTGDFGTGSVTVQPASAM